MMANPAETVSSMHTNSKWFNVQISQRERLITPIMKDTTFNNMAHKVLIFNHR